MEVRVTRKVVGLDVGTTAVRAAELSARRGEIVLERFGQIALPPGAVIDGEVAQPEVVAGALKELWKRVRYSTKQVVVGVANQRVVVRLTDLPAMPEAELRASLRYQVQEYIPIPVDEAELDVNILGEHEETNGQRMMRVLLVAAQKDMVAGLVDAIDKAGLDPVGVDLTPFALLRALAPEGAQVYPEAGEALVDVGARVTNIVVHEAGVPRFIRILLMGGHDVTEALATALSMDPERAEMTKFEVGSGAVVDQAAAGVVSQKLDTFAEEVRGSLDFFRAQSGALPIARVLVTGGGSRLGQLVERLGRVLNLPVEPAHVLGHVRLGRLGLRPEQLAELDPVAPIPVGLALGEVR
jgi:type IV pilus assembly protein PilM